MNPVFKYILLFSSVFLVTACIDTKDIHPQINVGTDSVSVDNESIIIRSSISKASILISEHGHCWSNSFSIPLISNSEFTCLGPTFTTTEFSENVKPGTGTFYIRAYIIIDSYVVYGEIHEVTI